MFYLHRSPNWGARKSVGEGGSLKRAIPFNIHTPPIDEVIWLPTPKKKIKVLTQFFQDPSEKNMQGNLATV